MVTGQMNGVGAVAELEDEGRGYRQVSYSWLSRTYPLGTDSSAIPT